MHRVAGTLTIPHCFLRSILYQGRALGVGLYFVWFNAIECLRALAGQATLQRADFFCPIFISAYLL